MKVYTTLDLDLQKAAESEVSRGIEQIEQRQLRRKQATIPGDPLQAALVSIDPVTGEVRAMVGGRDFGKSHFNRVTQAKRQPGSSFKPLVYAAALDHNFTPASVIVDEPISFNDNGRI